MVASILTLFSALTIGAAPPACTATLKDDGMAFTPASPAAPLIVLEGRIKDFGPVSVIFDTGAAAPFDLFVSPSLAAKLALPLSHEIAPSSTTAVGPGKQTYRGATLSDFTLGPVVLHDTTVAVVPMIDAMPAQLGHAVDVIVGAQFVHNRVIAIDYAHHRLQLAAMPGDPARTLAFTWAKAKPLPLVTATINGEGPFTLQIDSGATTTSLSPTAASRVKLTVTGHGKLGGAGGAVDVAVGHGRVAFGGVTRDLPAISITDAIATISAAAETPIDGILGSDFFAGSCLKIDYPRQRLWLTTPKS